MIINCKLVNSDTLTHCQCSLFSNTMSHNCALTYIVLRVLQIDFFFLKFKHGR